MNRPVSAKAVHMKKNGSGKSRRNYYIAVAIIAVLAVIFVLAQQEPLLVNGKNGGVSAEQVIARLLPHLKAEPELANSNYETEKPAIELLSAKILAEKVAKEPLVYASAKAGNYEIRYNNLLVFFDYSADKVNGIFIVDSVSVSGAK